MNDGEIIGKVHSSMYHQCQKRGYAAPVDVLMDIGVLPEQKYEDWRFGRVSYLEAICTVNLRKLSFIMHQMRIYARKNDLKPSYCYYKRWGMKKKNGQGHKPVIPLRFSKNEKPEIEKGYATHFVDVKRITELKKIRRSDMNGQKNLENDEKQFLIKSLTEQTILGKIQWTCTEYNPISLTYGIADDSADDACLSQMFDAETNLNGHAVQVDIMERIELGSGKGDITGSVSLDGEQGFERYEYGISYDTDYYDDCDAESVGVHYRESLPAALANALLPTLTQSEAVASGFSFARFCYEDDEVGPLLHLPLAKLGEKLMRERRLMDFHRMVLDMEFRRQLLTELC